MASIMLDDVVPALSRDFDGFFRAHYGPLVRAMTVAFGNREEADDAVQEAFVRAHARWSRISRYDDPSAWVRRVAINRLLDVHRRGVRGLRARARLGPSPAVPGPEPGSGVIAALAELPQQQRIAMALFYVHDLSVAEVAASMELSEGAVKFHLHQGRDRLRTILGGSDV